MSTQSLTAVQNGAYTYLYDESTGKTYQLTNEEAASVFNNSGNMTVGDSASFGSSSADYVCTDGKDDAKISAGEATVSIFKGIVKMIVSPVTEALKGNFVPAAVAVAGTAVVGLLGPVGVIGASVVGLVGGSVQLINGINNIQNADSDGEVKQAFEQIGQGGFAALTSLFGLRGGAKQLKGMKQNGKLAEAEGFSGKVKAYFEDLKANKAAAKAARQEKKAAKGKGGDDGTNPPPTDDGTPPPANGDDTVPPPGEGDGGTGTKGTGNGSKSGMSDAETEDFIKRNLDGETGTKSTTIEEGDDAWFKKNFGEDLEQPAPEPQPAAKPEPPVKPEPPTKPQPAAGAKKPTDLETAKAALEQANKTVSEINDEIYAANWEERSTVGLEARLSAAEQAQAEAQSVYDNLLAKTKSTVQYIEGKDGQFSLFEETRVQPRTLPEETLPVNTSKTQLEGQMSLFDAVDGASAAEHTPVIKEYEPPVINSSDIVPEGPTVGDNPELRADILRIAAEQASAQGQAIVQQPVADPFGGKSTLETFADAAGVLVGRGLDALRGGAVGALNLVLNGRH